jgi:hypothetical protein
MSACARAEVRVGFSHVRVTSDRGLPRNRTHKEQRLAQVQFSETTLRASKVQASNQREGDQNGTNQVNELDNDKHSNQLRQGHATSPQSSQTQSITSICNGRSKH